MDKLTVQNIRAGTIFAKKAELFKALPKKEMAQSGEQYWMWNSLHNVFEYGKKMGYNEYRQQVIEVINEVMI